MIMLSAVVGPVRHQGTRQLVVYLVVTLGTILDHRETPSHVHPNAPVMTTTMVTTQLSTFPGNK